MATDRPGTAYWAMNPVAAAAMAARSAEVPSCCAGWPDASRNAVVAEPASVRPIVARRDSLHLYRIVTETAALWRPHAPPWRGRGIALSSPEGAKEENAMPSEILFTSTSVEIVEDAHEMSPAGFELIAAAPGSVYVRQCAACRLR